MPMSVSAVATPMMIAALFIGCARESGRSEICEQMNRDTSKPVSVSFARFYVSGDSFHGVHGFNKNCKEVKINVEFDRSENPKREQDLLSSFRSDFYGRPRQASEVFEVSGKAIAIPSKKLLRIVSVTSYREISRAELDRLRNDESRRK